MQIQNLMIAAIQNLGKLLRYGHNNGKLISPLLAIRVAFNRISRVLLAILPISMPYVSEY